MLSYISITAIYLAAFFGFYKALLQKETFYKLNRVVLIAGIILAFILPLVQVPKNWSFRSGEANPVAMAEPQIAVIGNPLVVKGENAIIHAISDSDLISLEQVGHWLLFLYWFGVVVFGLFFLFQLFLLLYRAYTSPVIRDGRYRIVELTGDKSPCSFGNNIFINPEKYDWETYSQILVHEKIHIQQGHSFDIMLAELLLVFQWFNPFAWKYRQELENNLEFLTDDKVLKKNNIEKSSYQMNLLKVSVPHFPLSLTTNYNQRLLTRRMAMMNAKRSSIHHGWKYLFIIPLLVSIASLVNEPAASARQAIASSPVQGQDNAYIATDGMWFAKIKDSSISIQLKGDGDDPSALNGSFFSLSEFSVLPRNANGSFSLTRAAGVLHFSGKFEGEDGAGRYQFTPNKYYHSFIEQEGVTGITSDRDLLTLFLVGVTQQYVSMLKQEGYSTIRKNDLIALYALNVDKAYIRSIKQAGFPAIRLSELVSFRSLKVNDTYIKRLQSTGDQYRLPEQVITYRAHNAGLVPNAPERSSEAVHTIKNPGIQEEIRENIRTSTYNVTQLQVLPQTRPEYLTRKVIPWKELPPQIDGVDVSYIREISDMGYDRVNTEDLRTFKILDVTKEYLKSFEPLGYSRIPLKQVIQMKGNKITPEFVQSFIDAGYRNIPMSTLISFKSLHITPVTIDHYKKMGYERITPAEIIEAEATGVSPTLKTPGN